MDGLNLVPRYLENYLDRKVTYIKGQTIDQGEERMVYELENGREIVVGCSGELMVILGPQKSRKTLLLNSMLASTFTQNSNASLNFRSRFEGRPVIIYDTEQPRHRTADNIRRLIEASKVKELPPNIYIFNLKGLFYTQMMEFVTHSLEEVMQKEGTEPALIAIDQIAKFCKASNVNDQDSVGQIETNLTVWQQMANHKALLLPVIHTNRGGQNTDGWLGKMLDKECDSQFRVSIDKDTMVSTVEHKEARSAPIPSFEFRQNFEGHCQLMGIKDFSI